MRTCKDISELVSASLDRDLSFSRRLGVRLHLLMCKPCALYERQLLTLRTILGKTAVEESDHGPELSNESSQRLQKAIDEELTQ
jgi:hypothetical protein